MTEQPFPANSVVAAYISTEHALYDFLRAVPYCPEHKLVWSPALATILLETCSQLDSLWQYEARQSPYVTERRLTIGDYFGCYGQYLATKWLLFYGETPEVIRPFDAWVGAPRYEPEHYSKHKLQWWGAYTSLKHDRFLKRTEAKLQFAVQALAGLFLCILRSKSCRNAVAQAGWLYGDGYNLQAHLGEDSPSDKLKFITAESKLFTYALGWGKEELPAKLNWLGPCSLRFRHWLDHAEESH